MHADASTDTKTSTDSDAAAGATPDVSLEPERVAKMLERGEVQVIDVREGAEWDAGHVAGALHVELDQVQARADTIEKGTPVVFQCRGGSRSEMVASAFRAAGWDAYNMDGGLRAWADSDLPLEPEDGEIVESQGLPGR